MRKRACGCQLMTSHSQGDQHSEGIAARDAVDAVHEIENIDGTRHDNEADKSVKQDDCPLLTGERRQIPRSRCDEWHGHLRKHQQHANRLQHQAQTRRQRMDVVDKTDHRNKGQTQKEQGEKEPAKRKSNVRTEDKDHATTTQGDAVGRSAL